MKPQPKFKHKVLHHQYHNRSFGEIAADTLATNVGSWRFIIIQTVIIFGVWIPLNAGLLFYQLVKLNHWDPYPFILLNLMLSLQAAFTGPVLQLSSNRQSVKDRALWEHTALEADINDRRMMVMMEGMKALLTGLQEDTSNIERELEELRRARSG